MLIAMYRNVSNQFTCLLLQVLKYKSSHDKDSKKGNIQGKNGKAPEATYDKAITVMCLHSSPGLNIGMILIKTQGNCDKVFGSNLKACDYRDGFGPGCFVVVMSPNYVTSTFGGDEKGVPILEYSGPLFKVNTLKTKMTIPDIVHNDSVEKMSGLYYRNVKIVVINTDVVSSVCRGYLCDSLGLNPNSTKVHTGCPCYTPVTELSRVLLMFNLFVVVGEGTRNEQRFPVNNYLSQNFTYLLTKNGFPAGYCPERIHTEGTKFDNIVKAVNAFVNHANREGGFSVVGWYRHGYKYDQSMRNAGAGDGCDKSSDFIFNLSKISYNGPMSDALTSLRVDVHDIMNAPPETVPTDSDDESDLDDCDGGNKGLQEVEKDHI
jgi:hypothetical protein